MYLLNCTTRQPESLKV